MHTDDLRYYYEHFYPYDTLYRWLTYNDTVPFVHRELSFEYENDSVQRYVKFRTAEEMRSRMTAIMEDPPRKVDAGAVWTGIPAKDNKQVRPFQREFIFDFDMNDYDDVRTCCSGKTTCAKCWKFMLIAKDVLTQTLTEDFGFEKFMFVFSGGRGLHIWICDQQARMMSDSVRKSIVDYLQLVTGNDKAASLLAENVIPPSSKVYKVSDPKNRGAIKNQILNGMHPHIGRSLNIIRKWFIEVFNQQEPLQHQRCREIVFKILEARSKKLRERVIARWQNCENLSEKMLKELQEEVDHYERTTTDEEYPLRSHEIPSRRYVRITFIEEEIMLSFLYPRMDYNVSTMQNHLLKLPFSIHPSTKNVSVPLFSHEIDKFDPQSCIKLQDLMKELDQLQKEGELQRAKNVQNAHKTHLHQYLQAMEQFCAEL